jgi:hypothetical protein
MKAPNRKLEFTIAFRGEDFRNRHSALLSMIEAELERPDSPFLRPARPDEGKSEELFKPRDNDEQGVTGGYFRVVMHIKDTFRPFGASTPR